MPGADGLAADILPSARNESQRLLFARQSAALGIAELGAIIFCEEMGVERDGDAVCKQGTNALLLVRGRQQASAKVGDDGVRPLEAKREVQGIDTGEIALLGQCVEGLQGEIELQMIHGALDRAAVQSSGGVSPFIPMRRQVSVRPSAPSAVRPAILHKQLFL